MSSGTQNIPLIRLEQRVEDLRKGFKLNSTSSLLTIGASYPILNITSSGLVGINVASPNTESVITIKNNDQIGWQNASAFLTRVPSSVSVLNRDAGARIFKSSDNNFYIDNMDGNTVFRRGGVVSGANFLFSNTIFISGASGNVGFSNSAPEARLHIGSGDLLLENNRQISFKNTSGSIKNAFTVNTANSLLVTAPNQLILRAGSDFTTVEGIRIHSDGTVGISGTKTPVTPITDLHVEGNQFIKGNRYYFTTLADFTTTATISGAELVAGWIRPSATTGTPSLTFPTATSIDSALPPGAPTGTTFEVMITNVGTVAFTLVTNTGLSFSPALVASMPAGTNRLYVFIKFGTASYGVYLV